MTPQPKARKRADIQILRAIAVIAVIVFHLDRDWLPGGYLGVDVFFVISGFLITGLIIKQLQQGNFSLTNFFLRRIKRLFPALAVMLLGTICLAVICLPPIPYQGLMTHAPWSALQMANLSLMRAPDYFGPAVETNPVLHTWSLAAEEQFYLIWAPLLLISFRYFPRKLGALFTVIIFGGLMAEYLTTILINREISFFSPVSRIWELTLGAFAALAIPTAKRNHLWIAAIGYGVLLASLLFLTATDASSPLLRAIPCIATVSLLRYRVPVTNIRFIKLPVYIGDLSYSLYLWHWPIICLSPYLFGFESKLLTTVLFTALAIISYQLCEKPLHRSISWNRFFSPAGIPVYTGLALVPVICLILSNHHSSEWRFQGNDVIDYTYTTKYTELPKPPFAEIAAADIALIGDSHAKHFAPMVEAWAAENDMTVATFWGSEFLVTGRHSRIEKLDKHGGILSTRDESEIARKLNQTIVESSKVKVVFIALRTAFYLHEAPPFDQQTFATSRIVSQGGTTYETEITDYLSLLTNRGIQVVLLGQAPPLKRIPKPGASIIDRLLKRDWIETDIWLTPKQLERLNFENTLYQKLSRHPQVSWFPTAKYINGTTNKSGTFLYQDDNHLSYQGAMSLLPALKLE